MLYYPTKPLEKWLLSLEPIPTHTCTLPGQVYLYVVTNHFHLHRCIQAEKRYDSISAKYKDLKRKQVEWERQKLPQPQLKSKAKVGQYYSTPAWFSSMRCCLWCGYSTWCLTNCVKFWNFRGVILVVRTRPIQAVCINCNAPSPILQSPHMHREFPLTLPPAPPTCMWPLSIQIPLSAYPLSVCSPRHSLTDNSKAGQRGMPPPPNVQALLKDFMRTSSLPLFQACLIQKHQFS